ncbi:MAG: protein kinase [Verrucomicrobiota bacterium]|nr:protein kinase [Verrucomicrobiota bacterium]
MKKTDITDSSEINENSDFRVLVVDDEESITNLFKDLLSSKGYAVDTAVDAEDALNLLGKRVYSIVFTDVNMPEKSGIELQNLSLSKRNMDFVIMTGFPNVKDAVKVIKMGALDYMQKPFKIKDILEKVSESYKKHTFRKKAELNIKDTVTISKSILEYKTRKMIGSGNAGIVMLVEKEGLEYAMKILRKEPNAEIQKKNIRRFLQEGRILSEINHPNIVKVFDYGISDEQSAPYMIMEYIKGSTLKEYMNEFEIPMNNKIKIFLQIIEALNAIHKAEIIHRDMKPANILITEHLNVKLVDFGIAKVKYSSLTLTSDMFGSPAYMAPECFNSFNDINFNADIFSLGVLGYELFTGDLPFSGDSIFETIYAIRKSKKYKNEKMFLQLPDCIQKILTKMLIKNPEHRFGDTKECLHFIKQNNLRNVDDFNI